MPIPHRRYVLFLKTRGDDAAAIVKRCQDLELPVPTKEEMAEIDAEIAKVLPPSLLKNLSNPAKRPRDFIKWMNALDLTEAWGTEKDYKSKGASDTFRTIMDCMDEPKIRLAMEGLSLVKQKPGDIARMISSRYLCALTEIHIAMFHKYFFDVTKLKRRDWKAYFERVDGRRKDIFHTALTDDIETLKVELDLPADISVASTLQFMLSKAAIKAKIYLSESSPEANKEARSWVDTVTKIVDKYEKYRTRDAADLSKSLQLEFDYVEETYDEADATLLAEVQSRKEIGKEEDK